jgi:hypothetical protein
MEDPTIQSDRASTGAQAAKKGEPSIFAQMMDLNCELRDAMGIEVTRMAFVVTVSTRKRWMPSFRF